MGDVVVRTATLRDLPTVLSLLRELAAFEGKLESVRIDESLLAEYAFSERACIEVLLGLTPLLK